MTHDVNGVCSASAGGRRCVCGVEVCVFLALFAFRVFSPGAHVLPGNRTGTERRTFF